MKKAMSDDIQAVIRDRAERAWSEREALLLERADIDLQLESIDKTLADCQAAARLFGFAPEEATSSEGVRDDQTPVAADDLLALDKSCLPPRRRVEDLIIRQLGIAGASGALARAIHEGIIDATGIQLNDKTVATTLYRLLRVGKVRRKNRNWLLASPACRDPL